MLTSGTWRRTLEAVCLPIAALLFSLVLFGLLALLIQGMNRWLKALKIRLESCEIIPLFSNANFVRLWHWWNGVPKAQTRTSRFAALNPKISGSAIA
jgi:hypothetical protein